MTTLKSFLAFAFAFATLVLALQPTSANAEDEKDATELKDYTTPQLAVPYATEKPVIDGTVNDDEWQQAVSINGLQTLRGKVAPRQTRFWVLWDEDNLYMD